MNKISKPSLHIVSVGECTIDDYVELQREFVGGISLNFAVHCKRSGTENVSLVSCIGDDHGARILQELAREGVDTSNVTILQGVTARQNITLTPTGDRIFPTGGYQVGVLEGYQLQDREIRFVQQHNLLASAMFKQVEPLFFQVMKPSLFEGWRVADFLDLSDYNNDVHVVEQFIDRLKIAFISGDRDLVERLLPLSRLSDCLIVVTLGADGSIAILNGEPMHQPSLKVLDVVDSTGCGDAFQAAFTISYWNDGNVRRALQCGAQQAARVLQHYGAIG